MEFVKKFTDKRSPFSFFTRFLLCFIILYYFFPFYRGITGEGGRFYSPFLDVHFNLVKGLTGILVGPAKFILEALHFDVIKNNYHTLRIGYSRGISVNPSCLGWGVMSFWAAFVFANTGTAGRKLKWMVGGVASILVLNITRIVLIAVANHYQWKTFNSIDAHTMFNILSYGCIFIFIFWFMKLQKKYEGLEFEREAAHSLSVV